MTAAIVRLLPADEQTLLKAYVEGTRPPDDRNASIDNGEMTLWVINRRAYNEQARQKGPA